MSEEGLFCEKTKIDVTKSLYEGCLAEKIVHMELRTQAGNNSPKSDSANEVDQCQNEKLSLEKKKGTTR